MDDEKVDILFSVYRRRRVYRFVGVVLGNKNIQDSGIYRLGSNA